MDLNKTTLSGQIYDILRQDILTQRIRLGEKLTLKHLQERFGVSSTPIREALTRLAEEELVVSYSNIGVNVISIGEQDLKELYEFMGDLDALAILYTSHYPDQEKVQKALAENIHYTEKVLETESLTEEEIRTWTGYSDHFHLIFYDYCANSRLARAAGKQRSQLTIFSNMYEASLQHQREIERGHLKIYGAYFTEGLPAGRFTDEGTSEYFPVLCDGIFISMPLPIIFDDASPNLNRRERRRYSLQKKTALLSL